MTKLDSKTKYDLNIHTMRDRHAAHRRLNKLAKLLEADINYSKTDLDVTSSISKKVAKEVII